MVNEASKMVELVEALSEWERRNEIPHSYGHSAQSLADFAGGHHERTTSASKAEVRALRVELVRAERRGELKALVLRCEGRGRKGTRQVFGRKFYTVARG